MNRAATQVSHFGPAARQVRWRQWLFPQTSKGWQPERFEHEGKALQFARQSKRIPIWKLGWATTIPTKYLIMVEHGQARLGPAYREERHLWAPSSTEETFITRSRDGTVFLRFKSEVLRVAGVRSGILRSPSRCLPGASQASRCLPERSENWPILRHLSVCWACP
ncbi:unnamed protein product [Durusdinium trenchii]